MDAQGARAALLLKQRLNACEAAAALRDGPVRKMGARILEQHLTSLALLDVELPFGLGLALCERQVDSLFQELFEASIPIESENAISELLAHLLPFKDALDFAETPQFSTKAPKYLELWEGELRRCTDEVSRETAAEVRLLAKGDKAVSS